MKQLTNLLFKISIPIILIGGTYLFWYHHIDGVHMNKTIVYREDIDPSNFQLEKHEYRPGEMVRAYTAYCKNRNAIAVTTWTLANEVLTIYPPKDPRATPEGCYPSGKGLILFEIQPIPSTATAGCNHYFTGYVNRDIGGGRVYLENIKTETFCVVTDN